MLILSQTETIVLASASYLGKCIAMNNTHSSSAYIIRRPSFAVLQNHETSPSTRPTRELIEIYFCKDGNELILDKDARSYRAGTAAPPSVHQTPPTLLHQRDRAQSTLCSVPLGFEFFSSRRLNILLPTHYALFYFKRIHATRRAACMFSPLNLLKKRQHALVVRIIPRLPPLVSPRLCFH